MDVTAKIGFGFFLGWDRKKLSSTVSKKLDREAHGIRIDTCGHNDYPGEFVVIAESVDRNKSFVGVADLQKIELKPEWIERLDKFCDAVGLDRRPYDIFVYAKYDE